MVKKNLSELISKVVYPGFPWKGRPHAHPERPHYLARSSSNQSILHLIVASCQSRVHDRGFLFCVRSLYPYWSREWHGRHSPSPYEVHNTVMEYNSIAFNE